MRENLGKRPNIVLWRVIRAKDGSREEGWNYNLRTNAGTNWQVSHMMDGSIAPIKNIALTEDSAAPATSNTSLPDELTSDGLSRTTATFSHTADQSLATLSASWQYTGGSTVTIAKAGVAHDSERTLATQSSDTFFLITAVSPSAVLTSNDTLEIDWGVDV